MTGNSNAGATVEVLQPSKLLVPQLLPRLVQRARLIDRLRDTPWQRLILISAPAGYGKSTLAAQWLACESDPVAWLSLDRLDNDPARFWRYLLASVRSVCPDADAGPNPDAPTMQEVVLHLINDLNSSPHGLLVVLDDYHHIHSPEIHAGISALVESLPAGLRLVLLSRNQPPLPLARWRARDQLNELTAADLSATEQEAELVIGKLVKRTLPSDITKRLLQRTEGWLAGLQLAALYLRGQEDAGAAIEQFGGRDRFVLDYLVSEVLEQQPPELQDFLLRTSVLERLDADLCRAITDDPDCQQMLERLDEANLFLVPLDNLRESYRYHHLFADLLRHQLARRRPDLAPELHRKAADALQRRGQNREAIIHLIEAGDFEAAKGAIDESAVDTLLQGEIGAFLGWIEALPDSQLREQPRLCLFHAWSCFISGRYRTARERLDQVEQDLEDTQDPEVLGILAALGACLASIVGDLETTKELTERALGRLPQHATLWRGLVQSQLATAYALNGQLGRAQELYEKGRAMNQQAGNSYDSLVTLWRGARLDLLRGELHAASQQLQAVVRELEDLGLAELPLAAYCQLDLAQVYFERDEIDKAADKAFESRERLQTMGGPTILLECYLLLSRIAHARGDQPAADSELRHAEDLVAVHRFPPLIACRLVALQALRLIRKGRPGEAEGLLRAHGFVPGAVGYATEPVNLVRARILLLRGEYQETRSLLADMRVEAASEHRDSSLLEVDLLMALAHLELGSTEAALQAIAPLLDHAEREGYRRLFREGPPGVERVLELAANRGGSSFARRLLTDADAPAAAPTHVRSSIEPLSGRELTVLRLLLAGMSNKEIAKETYVSVNTVKTHVRNIYGKLGVGNRIQLASRARELDLA